MKMLELRRPFAAGCCAVQLLRLTTVRSLFIAALCMLTLEAEAQGMQVIELRYRLAEHVLPTLQPLVEPGGVITGKDNVLFVRTSAANYEQIRQAVALLDRAAREVLITVGQGSIADANADAVRAEASIGSGSTQVGINRPPGEQTGIAVQAGAREQRTDLRTLASVRTQEGQETLISRGQSVPFTTTEVAPYGQPSTVRQTTTYRNVSSGFYATVRLSGERVTIDIAPRQQRLSASGTTVHTSAVHTTVSGRLGEWIPVGGVTETAAFSSGSLLTEGSAVVESGYRTWLKVDEIR